MPTDPFAIAKPKEEVDPFAIKTPRNTTPQIPELKIVENSQSELDNISPRDLSIGESFKLFLLAANSMDPRKTDPLSLGEQMLVSSGVDISDSGEGIIEAGQSVQEHIRTTPNALGGINPTRRVLGQAIDEAGNFISSTIGMVNAGEDHPNSLVFNASRIIREATRTPEEILAQEGLADKFSRALLQTGSFLVGGRFAQKLLDEGPQAGAAIAAWLGAGVGGQAGKEDAIRHGATENQVDIAFATNAIVGLSEGLPVGNLLNKVDDLTGGFLSKRFKSKAGEIIAGGVEVAFAEALQETFQTFGENLTAADIAGYDPTRSLDENINEAAGIGGSVGFLLGLATTAMGVRTRSLRQSEIKEKILDPLNLNSLDEIAGPFSTLEGRIAELEEDPAYKEFQTILQQEEDQGAESKFKVEKADAEDLLGTKLNRVEVSSKESAPLSKLVRHVGIDSKIAQATLLSTPTKEVEGDSPLIERLERTPVVMALSQREDFFYRAALEKAKEEVERFEGKEKLDPIEKAVLAQHKSQVIAMKAAKKIEVELAKDLKALTARIRPILGKNSTILVTNTTLEAAGKPKSTQGAYHAQDINDLVVNVINLRTDELYLAASQAAAHPTEGNKAKLEMEKSKILSTFLHEFGHGVAYNNFQELHSKVMRTGATAEERGLFQGIVNDYYRFVGENLNQPIGPLVSAMMSLPRAAGFISALRNTEFSSLESFMEETADDPFGMHMSEVLTPKTIDYIFSFREYLAEEFAKTALGNSDLLSPQLLPFFEKNVADIKKVLGKAKTRFGSRSPTIDSFFRSHSIRQELGQLSKIIGERTEQNPIRALFNDGLLTKEEMDRFTQEGDVFNKFMDVGFNILQIAEQNPHIQGLQNYVQHLREWKNEVNNNLAIAEDRLAVWKNLGKKENETLGRLLLDETVGRKPDGGWLDAPRVFTTEEIASYNLSDEALQLRQDIKEDFRHSLRQMEEVLIAAKKNIFKDDPKQEAKEIAKVKKEFKDMAERPYFPLMRFGEYVLQIRAKGDQVVEGKEYSDGDIIEYQAFDTKKERDRALGVLKKQFPKEKITSSVSKQVLPNYSLQGMPQTLIDHLESKLQSTGLSEEVKKAIREVRNDTLPFKSFRKQFIRRKRVAGFSLDAQRAYANYMTSFSNHIARVKFDSKFKEDFENISNTIKAINRRDGGDSTKRAEILNHMNDHLQYVMNPVNEFVGMRSAAFFWFLGFNVKSAFVNLTQIPLVTYPYLAARFGDGQAVAQISRAYGTAIKALTKPKAVADDVMQMIEVGLNESWLDESLATELALAASEKNLDKTLPRKVRQQIWLKASHYGSLPFHTAEKLNRHVTAIAAYRLDRSKKNSHEHAVKEARRAVEKSQFEYARWARPRFMRGKLGGTVFVFQNYMQNALYFALGGDPGALRMLVMLFMVGGLMGLPFGEDLANVYDAAMTALKRRTGMKDPHTQIRVDLRKMLKEMEINPDLFLHGLSSSSFGLANIGEFMGWPIPDLDLSGSLSMGRIVPGTELLVPGRTDTFERAVAGGVERAGGAISSGVAGIGQAIFNSHPDQWKRWEKAMPAFMRQISKAARYKVRGEEATRSGYPIAGFDMHDTKDQGEIIGQALGFTPREVSKGWEGFIAQQQAVIYYETWRQGVLRSWNFAKENKDQEAVKEANQEIREYNSVVPFPEMKIGPDTRIKSFESYMQTRRVNAKKIEQSKPFRRLSSSIEAVFEDENN